MGMLDSWEKQDEMAEYLDRHQITAVWIAAIEEDDYDWHSYDVIGVYSDSWKARTACETRLNDLRKADKKKPCTITWNNHPEYPDTMSAIAPKHSYSPRPELHVYKVLLDEYTNPYEVVVPASNPA